MRIRFYCEDCTKTWTERTLVRLKRKLSRNGGANDGWIPVEERLPENEKLKLVTCQTKEGMLSVGRAYYMNGFWHGPGTVSSVIAWMPLPEPYRPEGSEE